MKKSSIKSKIAKNKSRAPKIMGAMAPSKSMAPMAPSKGMGSMMAMKKGGMTKKPGIAIMIAVGKPRGHSK